MARLIEKPTIVQSAGNKPKRIEEFVGLVNTRTAAASIARMTSPPGWVEPGQTPEFDEFTLVLKGTLRVETRSGTLEVRAGQAVIAAAAVADAKQQDLRCGLGQVDAWLPVVHVASFTCSATTLPSASSTSRISGILPMAWVAQLRQGS